MAGANLRCLKEHEAIEVLKDINEEDCGNHIEGRSLYYKVLRTRYYWLTMKKYAFLYTQTCDACQRNNNMLHQPTEPLHPIISPLSFMK